MNLPVLTLDSRTYDQALACIQCGLCLPACPTYTTTGDEGDSPRGRIRLMKGLADGTVAPSAEVARHLDLCLDCRACETACPSGVRYHELIEETREHLAIHPPAGTPSPTWHARLARAVFLGLLTRRGALRAALLPVRLAERMGLYGLALRLGLPRIAGPELARLAALLPRRGEMWPAVPEALTRPSARPTGALRRVGVFGGCVGSVMFARENCMAIDLLAACGAEVVFPPAQGCCGAIHHHNAAPAGAAALARRNIDAFESAELVVTAIGGCGAQLRGYATLLRDDPTYAARATAFVAKVRDISEALLELGPPPLRYPQDITITYHDACHLAHAQRVTAAPRQLLAMIPALRIVDLPESDTCCGAAGTYNLTQPAMATALADRKLANIDTTTAHIVASGNVGCTMHLVAEANRTGRRLAFIHPLELLHRSAFGRLTP